ncbi:hypothetical protein LHJMPILO_02591 [Aeromonas veronii]
MNEVNCTAIRRRFDYRLCGLRHAPHTQGGGGLLPRCNAMQCACCTLRQLTGLGAAGWVLPPVVRRGEGTRSGAPSWTTAQTQAVQGCTLCVVPPDLLPEPREPDAGGRTSGGGRSIGDFSLATQRKVTRQAAQRRRNPIEDGVLVSCMTKSCQLGGAIKDVTDPPHPSPLPQGERGRLSRTITLR